jgi:hypothetical protein
MMKRVLVYVLVGMLALRAFNLRAGNRTDVNGVKATNS